MSRGKLYTLFVFGLSVTVIFGSWFLTKELLNYKEAEVLAKKGQISIEVPVNVNENEGQDNAAVQGEFEGEVLSEDRMAQVLSVWEAGGRELLKEPGTEQMDMEQAIKAGRDWIDTLSKNNILPAYLSECDFDNTNAVFCTLDKQVSLEESLIGYWRITYVEGDVSIILVIHAVSGQVWKANISMSGDTMSYGTYSDAELLALAFPFMNGESTKITKANNVTYMSFPEGKVYAALKQDEVVVTKQEPVARLSLALCTDTGK